MSTLTTATPAAPGATPPGGGTNMPDWRAALPEDIRSEKSFEAIQGKDWSEAGPALAKSYLNAQRLVGADKLVLPTDKSTPEEIAAFRLKLGVPAKFEDYGTGKIPEGLKPEAIDKAQFDSWRKELHEAGVPKAAAERLIGKFLSDQFNEATAKGKAFQDKLAENELAVKQEHGAKFDETLNYARWTAKEFGDEPLLKMLDESGMGSDPAVVRFFAKVGRAMADHKLSGGGAPGGGGGSISSMSPPQAQMALAEFERNPENIKALHNRADPNHAHVIEQRTKLYQAAYPSEQPAG